MDKVYSWATPNGHQVHIKLAERGRADRAIPVDIGAGDQFQPDCLANSPNNRRNQGITWADHLQRKRWFDGSGARPAVRCNVQALADLCKPPADDTARAVLFGARQQQRH